MPAFTELYLDQGSSYSITITLNDDTTNASINLASYTIKSQIKKSYYSQNVSDNFACTIVDSANGVIGLSLPSANTANLKPGRYVFDVKMTVANNTTRAIEGLVFVSPSVTT